jgi:hypothetical protein
VKIAELLVGLDVVGEKHEALVPDRMVEIVGAPGSSQRARDPLTSRTRPPVEVYDGRAMLALEVCDLL